jgi:hypothetical protein
VFLKTSNQTLSHSEKFTDTFATLTIIVTINGFSIRAIQEFWWPLAVKRQISLAIVLGIIGIILGAIWTAASMVYENMRAGQATGQVLTIVNNWRLVYGAKRVDVADWTDITSATINNLFLPADMIQTGNTSYGVGPWTNSQVYVYGYQTYNGIIVAYKNLSGSACNRLANAVAGQNSQAIWAQINGASWWFPPIVAGPYLTSTVIASECTNANTNFIEVMYSM